VGAPIAVANVYYRASKKKEFSQGKASFESCRVPTKDVAKHLLCCAQPKMKAGQEIYAGSQATKPYGKTYTVGLSKAFMRCHIG
jgi:predicted transcriptional regulator of viral defense system